ncbi:unnamed protein product, partial [Amoebophrya sp. A25]|eukprot:GSA25T00018503001.1
MIGSTFGHNGGLPPPRYNPNGGPGMSSMNSAGGMRRSRSRDRERWRAGEGMSRSGSQYQRGGYEEEAFEPQQRRKADGDSTNKDSSSGPAGGSGLAPYLPEGRDVKGDRVQNEDDEDENDAQNVLETLNGMDFLEEISDSSGAEAQLAELEDRIKQEEERREKFAEQHDYDEGRREQEDEVLRMQMLRNTVLCDSRLEAVANTVLTAETKEDLANMAEAVKGDGAGRALLEKEAEQEAKREQAEDEVDAASSRSTRNNKVQHEGEDEQVDQKPQAFAPFKPRRGPNKVVEKDESEAGKE